MEWIEVFTPPFRLSENKIKLVDSKNRFCADVLAVDPTDCEILIDKLNDESTLTYGKFFVKDDRKLKILHRHAFEDNSTPVILIRGWGRLTGNGGEQLGGEIAYKLQVNFANWIIGKLNK